MAEKKPDPKSMLKTCHIFTVNIGHLSQEGESEEEQIELFEAWNMRLQSFPNVKVVRAQIERNKKGKLHINGGVIFQKPIRARTLENKMNCWAEPARNRDQVMAYGKKTDTRVKSLPNFGELKARKEAGASPKQQALQWLMEGLDPMEICAKSPEVYFTHHRAIMETWNMIQSVKKSRRFIEEDEEE